MHFRRRLSLALLLLTTGVAGACTQNEPQPAAAGYGDRWPSKVREAKLADDVGVHGFDARGWVKDKKFNCSWVLHYPDQVGERAHINGGFEDGVFLTLSESVWKRWPVDNRIKLLLRFDGDSAKSIQTLGYHPQTFVVDPDVDDASGILKLILERPARAMIANSTRVEVLRGGKRLVEIPLSGDLEGADLEACDPDPRPGWFIDESGEH